jgi:hypothetical protein
LASADGVLEGALTPTASGYRFEGRFRGAPLAADFFRLGDTDAAVVIVEGAPLELTVGAP